MSNMNRLPGMMQRYLMRRMREAEDAANDRRFSMKTKGDALAYQEDLKKSFRKIFGPLPEKTPLNARITGQLDRDEYTVHKVMFESRPNFPVTAALYIPKGYDFPQPGVLGPCGHAVEGKACDAYQSYSQGLAKKGYVVLCYDPMSQGERMQYPDGKGGSWVGPCTREHNHAGRQQILAGEFFGTWRAWDGIRACDYLVSRPEVDPDRLGITGNSGGGTMTSLICALDQRYRVAAPGCYITSWRRNAENELPADAEQQPPFALQFGLEMDDLFGLHAPNPLILLTQEYDYFDQRGAIEAFERLKHLYALFGAEDDVAMFTGDDFHGYAKPLREAMYGFFNRALDKPDETGDEPDIELEDVEDLWVTETGQVSDMDPAPRTVFSFSAEKANDLADDRGRVSGRSLKLRLRNLLNLPKRDEAPDYRILRGRGKLEDYPRPFITPYAVRTEPDIEVIVYMLAGKQILSRVPPGDHAVLYLPHVSADEDLREDALAKKLGSRKTIPFFAMDYRGVGESRPNTCGHDNFLHIYGSDYFYASYGLMFGEPYVGRRTRDVLAILEWLAQYGYDDIHLVARGWGTLPATFAALFHDRVTQVTLKNAPISFTEWATVENMQWPLSACPPYVLEKLDLPDCYRELAERGLQLMQPWSAEMKGMQKATARELFDQYDIPVDMLA